MRVGVGQIRVLEQREQTCERRSQLVGDGRGEAGAQLLVGLELPRLAEIHEALGRTANRVRDDRGLALEQLRSERLPDVDANLLAGAPARRDDAILRVEHDEELRCLLDQSPASRTVVHHSFTNLPPGRYP